MPSGADLEYQRLLRRSGSGSAVGLDGARLSQMEDESDPAEFKSIIARLNNNLGLLPTTTTVVDDTPAITSGAAATVTGNVMGPHNKSRMNLLGERNSWDTTFGRIGAGAKSGIDTMLFGDTIEYQIFPGITGTPAFWVFVNGVAVSLDTLTTVATTSSTTVYVKLVFPTVKLRRVEFFFTVSGSWVNVRVPVGQNCFAPVRTPVFGFLGDSFYGGSSGANAFQSTDFIVSRILGVEDVCSGLGGTGYVSAGSFTPFTNDSRIAKLTPAKPEVVVISGSVNDDGQSFTTIESAAMLTYYKIGLAMPNTKIIVFGPQPSGSTSTISVNRQINNAAIKSACSKSPNVLAFFDQIGHADGMPPAVATFQTYPDGQLVTSLGSVWKVNNGGGGVDWANGSSLPPSTGRWQLETAGGYFGTGLVGGVTGDGTRDTYLYSDGVHPTKDGSSAFAAFQAAKIREALTIAAKLS